LFIPTTTTTTEMKILEILAHGNLILDIKQNKLSLIIKNIENYLFLLKNRKVELEDLIFTKILSKNYNHYTNRNTLENGGIRQLELSGEYLKAGQILQYIVTEYSESLLQRVVLIQLVDQRTTYDVKRYF
jgi:DNA polymerase elongation subunit (family B)